LSNVRILVVDDDPDVLAIFNEVIHEAGATCDTVLSGKDALELMERGHTYDIYFIDWHLDDISGLGLADIAREKAYDPDDVAVVMISAGAMPIEADTGHVRIDKYLSKPIFPFVIMDAIHDCLGDEDGQCEIKKEMPRYRDRRLLLAEDVEINREIVIALLEETLIEIDCAENGKEAVRMFSESPEKYDLILMDIQMPEMDGYEATRNIRALEIPAAKTIPIVAMTANVYAEDVDKCLQAGMDDHIGKPLDLDNMLDKLNAYLKV
jgi:CheY-like chemotaxis protein